MIHCDKSLLTLSFRLKQHEDQMIRDRGRQGNRHMPTIITIKMEFPQEEEKVEEEQVDHKTDANNDTNDIHQAPSMA